MKYTEEEGQDNPDYEENPKGRISSSKDRKYCNHTTISSW